MSLILVKFENITKKYQNYVLKDFSINMDNSKYNFIIGKNGTGKSTLIKCLFNLVNYQGSIIYNKDIDLIYIPEKVFLPDYIKLIDFVKILTKKGLDEIYELLDLFEIRRYQNYFLCNLSFGTKQKMLLVCGLLKDGDGYVFDEPLNGLDEKSINNFISCLHKLYIKKKLIIIVSHRLYNYDFDNKNIIMMGNSDD